MRALARLLDTDQRHVGRYPIPQSANYALGHMDFMLASDMISMEDNQICSMILAELKGIYDVVLRTQGPCSMSSILCFPKQDPAAFSQLIKRRVPQALVLLAFYCVLLDVLDSRWWISGWASRVLRDVLSSLEEPWRQWIEWPVQSVLMRDRGSSMLPIPPPAIEPFVMI